MNKDNKQNIKEHIDDDVKIYEMIRDRKTIRCGK